MNLLFSYVPHNPSRVQIFGSLSNSINNVVIQKQSEAVFDQMRYFIITPDQLMDTAVREALSRSAVAAKDIFTEPIPSNIGDSELRGGLDEQADDFISMIRYPMALDAGAARPQSDIWRKKLPLVVLRVRDPRVEPQPVPYPRLELQPRTAAHNPSETDLLPDLIDLAEAVCARWGSPASATPRPGSASYPS